MSLFVAAIGIWHHLNTTNNVPEIPEVEILKNESPEATKKVSQVSEEVKIKEIIEPKPAVPSQEEKRLIENSILNSPTEKNTTEIKNNLDEPDKKKNQEEILKILQQTADQLEQEEVMDFQGISGVGQSFFKTTGRTDFENSVHTATYGGPYDIWWLELEESSPYSLNERFPHKNFEYLGGFGRYAAYQRKGYKKAYYGEYFRNKKASFLRILKKDKEISFSPELKEKTWIELKDPEENSKESLMYTLSTHIMHLPNILRAAEGNSSIIKSDQGDYKITYSIPVESLNKIEANIYASDESDITNDTLSVIANITSDTVLNNITLKYVPYIPNPYEGTGEAHYFTFHTSENQALLQEPIEGEKEDSILGDYKFLDSKEPKVEITPLVTPKELEPFKESSKTKEVSVADNSIQEEIIPQGYIHIKTTTEMGNLHAYDKRGGHVGIVKSIIKGMPGLPEEGIANGSYMDFGSMHYIGLPVGDSEYEWDDYYLIEFEGKAYGFTELIISDASNTNDISTIFLKVTPLSRGTMTIKEIDGVVHINKLRYDIDGDGITDAEYSHNNETTYSDYPSGDAFIIGDEEYQDLLNSGYPIDEL